MNPQTIAIPHCMYEYGRQVAGTLRELSERVADLRRDGTLSPKVLHRLRTYFKIKNIYHSNAIEGNVLDVGETTQVVERGLTITGKPLKDQAEARNLSEAVDFLEELARDNTRPIREYDIRQIHRLVLKEVDDQNAGAYRKGSVKISGSAFEPPAPERVPADMEELGIWLSESSCPDGDFASSRGIESAAVAHTWLVYVHPFVDGNGRVARLLMNLMLMRYGFPIAIISREDRLRYYDALEESQSGGLSSFMALLTESIRESLEEYETARQEDRDRQEWARSLAGKFSASQMTKARNEYEIWKNAMELMKSHMRDVASVIDSSTPLTSIYFKDFGTLEWEKFLSLKQREHTKRTWFFRVDFVEGEKKDERTARYLFLFGYAGPALRTTCDVTLHVAREEPSQSYWYERLSSLEADNIPRLSEIGYKIKDEEYACSAPNGCVTSTRIEHLAKQFYHDVIRLHFSSDG